MQVLEIQKWGNSSAVRLPSSVLKQVNMQLGDRLVLHVQKGKLVLEPAPREYTLEDLVSRITPENRHEAVETGAAVGREAW